MKQQIEQRLKALEAEYESGQKALAELEKKDQSKNTLLCLSCAIEVLEEELAEETIREQDKTKQTIN